MPVVVMQPGTERAGALLRAEVRLGIGPLSETGLDEALGLTIGSGSKGFGAQVPDPQLQAGVPEGVRDRGRAVVGHDTFDAHATLAEVLDRGSQEATGARAALVLGDAGQRDSGGIIDRHVHEVPADPAATQPPVAVDAMPDTSDSAELFRIQMQQLPGSLALVTHHRGTRFQIPPARQSGTSENARDTGPGEPQALADKAPGASLPAQLNDLCGALSRQLPRTAARSAGAILQPFRTLRPIAAHPLLQSRQ